MPDIVELVSEDIDVKGDDDPVGMLAQPIHEGVEKYLEEEEYEDVDDDDQQIEGDSKTLSPGFIFIIKRKFSF